VAGVHVVLRDRVHTRPIQPSSRYTSPEIPRIHVNKLLTCTGNSVRLL
jgi:hypothetical protein